MPVLAENRHALFDYEILEKWEAGLVLTGQEVKAARGGLINLKGAYVTVQQGVPWLINAHISPYKKATGLKDYEPTRSRRLLLRQKEITALLGLIKQKGLTVVPLKVYTKHNLIKIEIGLGRGRKKYNKRELLKKRDIERELRKGL